MYCLPKAENRQVSDAEYRQFTDSIIDKLIDAERVTTLVLKDIAAAAQATAGSPGGQSALAAAAATAAAQELSLSMSLRQQKWGGGDNFMADAAAEELRERLKQLAKQVVDMQVRAEGRSVCICGCNAELL